MIESVLMYLKTCSHSFSKVYERYNFGKENIHQDLIKFTSIKIENILTHITIITKAFSLTSNRQNNRNASSLTERRSKYKEKQDLYIEKTLGSVLHEIGKKKKLKYSMQKIKSDQPKHILITKFDRQLGRTSRTHALYNISFE